MMSMATDPFRVHIFGASGAGTTTLGAALSQRLGVPHFDSDAYYWLPTDPPFQQARPVADRLRRLVPRLRASSSWVLSGSNYGWGDPLIEYYELVVFLQTDVALRLDRLRDRERQRYGDAIQPGGLMYDNHQAFIRWAAQYDEGPLTMRSRASHEQWLEQIDCPVVRLDGQASAEQNIRAIRAARRPGIFP